MYELRMRTRKGRAFAIDLGQREVAADRHLPGVIDVPCRRPHATGCEILPALTETVAQRDGLERGDRHSTWP